MRVIGQVSTFLTWKMSRTIVDCLFPIVATCVLNKSYEHWFLNDALHFAISMNLKLKEKNEVVTFFHISMEDDSNVANGQLVLIASNQKGSLWNIEFSFHS
jgi:hypothetical protein